MTSYSFPSHKCPSFRVVLIEDDPDDVLLFKHALPQGCSLQVFTEGEAGLKSVIEDPPDMIFLDLVLPGINGESICRKIRESELPEIARTPIVILSGKKPQIDGGPLPENSAANAYIVKPYQPGSVQDYIRKYAVDDHGLDRKSNKILIIEDDPDDTLLLQTYLNTDRKQSYDLIVMNRFQLGFDYLKENDPDLIILDLHLPDSEGLESFYQLYATKPNIPIVILTDSSDELLGEEAILNGAQDVINKKEMRNKSMSKWIRYAIDRNQLMVANRNLALIDEITGLNSRRSFELLANQQLKLRNREKSFLTIAFMDLDNLKRINDRYGHSKGDYAIQSLADVLRKTFRESDILARIGGDEFVAIVDCCNEKTAEEIKFRLKSNLDAWNIKNLSSGFKLSCSIGVVTFCPDNKDISLESILGAADKEMYKDKFSK